MGRRQLEELSNEGPEGVKVRDWVEQGEEGVEGRQEGLDVLVDGRVETFLD